MATPGESALAIFRRSILTIFEGWTVLQLAVSHGYGGIHSREKALWLVDAVYNWFQENEGVEPDELQDFIAEIMDNEFDTRAEDGSLIEISEMICKYFDLCKSGHEASVLQKIEVLPKACLRECQAVANSETEEFTEDNDRVPSEHNLHAMMNSMEVNTSEGGEPVVNGLPDESPIQSSKMETPAANVDEDGWTVVRKSKKK